MSVDLKTIAKTAVSFKAIFECRNSKTYRMVVLFMLINIGFIFPFVVGVLSLEQISVATFLSPNEIQQINEKTSLDFLKNLTIHEGYLEVDDPYKNFAESVGNYTLTMDYEDNYVETEEMTPPTIRLSEAYMEMRLGITLFADYQNFEDIAFKDLSNAKIIDYFVKNGIKNSVGQWLFPVVLFFYLAFLIVNFLFILGMSALGLLFGFRDHVKLSYKETLNVVIGSSVIPVILSMVITLLFDTLGLNLMIYNFGTIAVFMIVRKKYMKSVPLEKAI
jgi:maltodextrin utilization protein YvdJ